MACEIIDTINQSFPNAIIGDTEELFGTPQIHVFADSLRLICDFLHEKNKINYLEDVTAVDFCDKIELIYRLRNIPDGDKLVIKVDTDRDNPQVPSLTGIWKGADFQEREVYDLMGVVFEGHPNLRRILLPDDWSGYPLRKDYVIDD